MFEETQPLMESDNNKNRSGERDNNQKNELSEQKWKIWQTIRKFGKKFVKPRRPKIPTPEQSNWWTFLTDVETGTPKEDTLEDIFKKKEFLVQLAKSLHAAGSPVHRTEYHLTTASKALGILGTIAILPTCIFISFGAEDGNPEKAETKILKVKQGLNCEHLFLLSDLADKVASNQVDHVQGMKMLEEIRKLGPYFSYRVKLACFVISSASLPPLFFGGGWLDLVVSFFLGIMVGSLCYVGEKYAAFGRVLEPAVSLAVGFFGRLLDVYLPGQICFVGVALSSFVWLLPGLSLTIAITELATKNMISGTSRIFNAMLISLELGFGLAIGSRLVFWRPHLGDQVCGNISDWYNIILIFGVVIPFVILLDAHPHQWPPMIMCSLLAYVVSYFSQQHFTPDISAVMSSFVVGISSSVYARITKKSSLVSSLAGILLLVPGSLGVRGTSSFLANDVISGINFTFQMLVTGVSLTVGLFCAKLILPPQHSLHPEYYSTLF